MRVTFLVLQSLSEATEYAVCNPIQLRVVFIGMEYRPLEKPCRRLQLLLPLGRVKDRSPTAAVRNNSEAW